MTEMGKFLIWMGIVFIVAGLLMAAHVPWLGRLPGDIAVKKENFSFYFPITTCILLSVILTILFRMFHK